MQGVDVKTLRGSRALSKYSPTLGLSDDPTRNKGGNPGPEKKKQDASPQAKSA